jgi:hypothetical protein
MRGPQGQGDWRRFQEENIDRCHSRDRSGDREDERMARGVMETMYK